MSIETLALNSIISEQISLESGIAPFDDDESFGIFDEDEESYVSISDNDLFSFIDDAPFTISSWVWLPDFGSAFRIINKYDASYGLNGREWQFSIYESSPYFYLYDEDNDAQIGRWANNALDGLERTQNHIVATYDGNGMSGIKIYVNGVRVDDTDKPGGSGFSSTRNTNMEVRIGRLGNSYYSTGKMKDIKIFDVELTAEQVLTEYGANNRTADLVAHYKLYTDVLDSGGSGLDGVNTNVTFPVSRSLLEITSGVETTLALNSSLL